MDKPCILVYTQMCVILPSHEDFCDKGEFQMKKMSRILSSILVLCMILSMIPAVFAADTTDFVFLVTSDLHGQFYATDYTVAAEKSGTYKRGLTRIASYVKEVRAEYGDNVYLADIGDSIQGAPLTYYYAFNKLDEEQPAMKAFRTMGYDMWVVGNHEFNYGMKILQKQLSDITAPATETETPVNVCMANYLKAETNSDESKDWATWNDYAPYQIKDFDGVKVAILGIGNPNIPKWDIPANWEGIYFADIIETYKHYEAEMLEKADMIVVAAHSGIGSDADSDFMQRLVEQTNTIAFVFSGHEHGRNVNYFKNTDGKEIPVLQPSTKAQAIAQVKVSYNKADKTYTLNAENVNAENKPLDEELVNVLKPYEEATWNEYMLNVIGTAKGDFPASNLGTAPSAFMDLINQVQLWGAYDRTGKNTPDDKTDDTIAQLSISAPLTSGNNANLIPQGDVHLGDMFGLYRFENWFYQIRMSGEEVHQWLEFAATKVIIQGGKPTVRDLTYYDVIYGDGFSYDIDYTAPIGARVKNMTYQGKEVKADDEFTVVLNNYRYNGGGNYVAWLNEHGCEFKANDPDRVIYSTQFDMIQGEDEGQARTLLTRYIEEQTKTNGGIEPKIDSTWKLIDGSEGAIEIFFTNDVHGAYENYAYAAEIAKYGDLLVDAGDNIQGSVATSLTKGQCMVDVMKAVGYDAAVPGNHEFDYGFDRFLEIVNGENTPYVSANLWDKKADKALLDGYKIFEAEGKKVAIVGITTPETLVKSTPTYFQDEDGNWIYDFCNDQDGTKLYTVVQKAVDEAKAEGADYVIAVGHLGIDNESEPWTSTSVIANTNGIDALIDGHSHSTFTNSVKNKDGKEVAVAQTGTKLAKIGRLLIAADGTITSELVNVVPGVAPYNKTVADVVKGISEEIDAVKSQVVAKSEVDLTTKDPETGKRAVRNAETNLGDLCADAYRDLLGTDIAFVNGGGVRADIAKGDVTYGQIIDVHPFGNMACSIEVTGQQIWEALELGAAAHPGESGGFLQVSGLTYTINDAIASPVVKDETNTFVGLKEGAPHKVTDVKVGGQPLDVTKTYTLGGHNYMLKNGGDGYSMFKGAKVLKDEIAVDNEVLIRYIRDTLKGSVAADSIYANPKGEGRITIINELVHPYTDVEENLWYTDAVKYAYCNGLMNGMTATTFEPDTQMSRAMLVTVLWRNEGAPTGEKNTFTDVKEGEWYTDAVAWAAANEIVNGMGDGLFAPHDPITREQLATILHRYAKMKNMDVTASAELADFSDASKVSQYAKEAVQWAVGYGIINGSAEGGETLLMPQGQATRGQIATMLMRLLAARPQ